MATYTRISTDEEHQPYSLDAQAERLDSYIKSQEGWTLVRRFTDQMTGSTLERPGLQRALLEGKVGRYELLLVYKVDRLARSVRGLAQILEDLDRAGVVFRSATEPFDTGTPAGRMVVQMLGVFAEFERATIIDRVVAGMERKAAKGGWTVGGRPFGYEIDSETGFLVVKEEEAQLVPMIFDLYLRERLGARSIGNWLNDRGYRTKAGKPWSHMSVLTVLRNNAYVGEIDFRGESYPAPHSALVERATFDAAQQLLTERGEDHSKRASNRSDYILASKIVCQRCGKHFVGSAATGNMYRYSYYTCFSRQRYGRHGCDAERLPSEELEAKILDSLIETFADKGLVSAAIEEARTRADSERPQIERELEAIQSEIRKVEGRIEKYLTAFEEGSMPEAVCGPRLEGLGERLAELKRRREELLTEPALENATPLSEGEVKKIAEGIRETITAGSPAKLKAVAQEYVHEIRVENRQAIYPVFRLPCQEKVRALYRLVDRKGQYSNFLKQLRRLLV